jgi:hypothetical protein
MLMELTEAKALLGVPAKDTTFDAQMEFALEVASSIITDYTGRRLIRQEYTETFFPPQVLTHWGREVGFFSLLEFPVETVSSVKADGADLSLLGLRLHKSVGLFKLPGIGTSSTIEVSYIAGYAKLPADLRAVVLEFVRRQLESMGVDLGSVGGAGAAGAPIRAVSVGQLRVEYAISLTAGAAKGTMSPVAGDIIEQFRAVLDLYRHPRRLAATPA